MMIKYLRYLGRYRCSHIIQVGPCPMLLPSRWVRLILYGVVFTYSE